MLKANYAAIMLLLLPERCNIISKCLLWWKFWSISPGECPLQWIWGHPTALSSTVYYWWDKQPGHWCS